MSNYLYAIHDIESAHMMNGKGWVIATEAVGADPNNQQGVDYSSSGATVICRLNYSYGSGTIPTQDKYEDFAQRCANFVRNSRGCSWFLYANEPNLFVERPPNEIITPEKYADCYNMWYRKIRPDFNAIPAAIGPWNVETGYWIDYFKEVLSLIDGCQGIAIHCYSHGSSPSLITDETMMNPPYQNDHYNFRVYRDFMNAIPQGLKHVPVFITETDQNDEWLNENNGWVQAAYKEIDDWNKTYQQIHCLALYRWQYDKYAIKDKDKVIEAFLQVQEKDYQTGGGDVNKIEDGFESGFYKYNGVGELECPNGWKPVWNQGTEDGILVRPEYKPAGTAQIRTGKGAAAIHSRYATIDGVLLRSFDVDANSVVKASIWMMKELPEGGHAMQIGIHPYGGENFLDDSVVWSDWYSQFETDYKDNEWRQRTVQATAKAETITVFLRSKVDNKVDGSNAHYDDFVLEYEDGQPEPPTPGGTLQDYLDAIKADAMQILADVEATESFVESGAIKALPVG